jgi:hypothetical protein
MNAVPGGVGQRHAPPTDGRPSPAVADPATSRSPVSHVWMYWEDLPGRKFPAYLDLCRETVRSHLGPSMALHLLDRTSVFDWLPDLDEAVWERLVLPAQRADYARTRLVFLHGGLWLDADCLAMRPLDELGAYLGEHDLVSWGADNQGRFFNNLFIGRAGAPLIGQWIEGQDRALGTADDWSQLSWAALGSDAFYPLIRDAQYANIPSDQVAPVLWYAWRRFLSPFQSPATVLEADPVTVMLWNKGMGPLLDARSAEDILRSKMLLSRLIRIALGKTSLPDELDHLTKLNGLSSFRYGPRGRSVERRLRRTFAGARTRPR